ncbi:PEP-CTERM sorting domain-containing protein [Mucisphaera sp.]|uniref:PEP-CTERM sorting domain-containing protein n=1 Tax=Mucisphaera sp. TaxID=2913024 RepID=UPI003D0AA725
MNKLHLTAALAAALTTAHAASAAVSVYGPTGPTDGTEADFNTLFPVTTPIDFDAVAAGTTLEVPGGLDDGNGPPLESPIAFDDFTLTIVGNNNTFDDTFVSTATELGVGLFDGEHETVTLTFNDPILAFAATFESPASSNGFEITIDGTEVDTFPLFLPGGGQGQQFLGLASDTPFTTVTFTSAFGGETFFIDNAVIAIPEPASLALLSLGALALRRSK